MGGKAAVLLVLGFSMIFLVIGHNYNNLSSNSLDNYFKYYNETNAYNLAVSGANMAASEIFFNNTWDDGFTGIHFNNGEINVYVDNPLGDGSGPTTEESTGKVKICHIPPGNPNNRHTIMVSPNAVPAHLAHGDYLGDCTVSAGADPSAGRKIRIISEGTVKQFGGEISKSVVVELSPSKFSRFAYFQEVVSSDIWWTSGDTVWGPMHIQGPLQVANSPVFYGKVTSLNGIEYYNDHGGHWEKQVVRYQREYRVVDRHQERKPNKWGGGSHWEWVNEYDWVDVEVKDWVWVSSSSADPKFYGGYESGVSKQLPEDGVDNLEVAANGAGHTFTGQDTVIVTFKADSINYKFSAADPVGTTVLGSELTNNGVIFVDDATLRISGIVKGNYTIGVNGSSYEGKGNVYIDDDLVYNTDPRDEPNSSDLLGIVAQNNVLITDNTANRSDINIDATIYSQEGGFGAENYGSRPPSGDINLLGGIINHDRRAVGTFSGHTVASGFNKKYRYDDRLLLISPPFFPGTGQYEIVSWYE